MASLVYGAKDSGTIDDMINWSLFKRYYNEPTSYTTTIIDNALADLYTFDFYGLLTKELGVSSNLVFPNILLNGLMSSCDYDGSFTTIKILNSDIANIVMKNKLR